MRGRSGRIRSGALAVMVVSGAATANAADAQVAEVALEARRSDDPVWLTQWSPLRPGRALARMLPGAPRAPDVLSMAAPRAGAFWTGGNPGALGLEVRDRRGELDLLAGGADGEYRRPLDEDGAAGLYLRGLRWQPLGAGSAIGRVVAGRTDTDAGSPGFGSHRHAPDPFVPTDTASPPMQHVRARVEGAYGWRHGPLGLGLSAGLDVSDDRSEGARVARLGRSSAPGVVVGGAYVLGSHLTLGVRGGWTGMRENLRFAAPPGALGVVHALHGYDDPQALEFSGRVISRITERGTWTFGADLAWTGGDWTAAVGLERLDIEDSHRPQVFTELPRDRWVADAWNVVGAVVGRTWSDRLLLSAEGAYRTLAGDATLGSLTGAILRRNDRIVEGRVEARLFPGLDPWTLAVAFEAGQDRREHLDFLAEATSLVSALQVGGSVEFARRVASSTALSLSLSGASRSASSTLPNPDALGPVYRALIAPELSLYATGARVWGASLTLRQGFGGGFELVVRGTGGSTSPTGVDGSVPLAPEGDRTRWEVRLGGRWTS